jgi:hypothetical protein
MKNHCKYGISLAIKKHSFDYFLIIFFNADISSELLIQVLQNVSPTTKNGDTNWRHRFLSAVIIRLINKPINLVRS